ncbi:MAG: translocation/assembly module TamB [Phenylobacterium sp.]|uniref:translocation/assembly module TamB domain-containing protein n=1 Tax=Phenylobacterium sp. TaxID=1871053 RepID=UPI0025FD1E95|nr:translocation/assembly module TamB domain-containing protein [Phenylobacterium sp.]MBI1200152.1 translocation/assembly module TamB [Phenylobacterium sp.]
MTGTDETTDPPKGTVRRRRILWIAANVAAAVVLLLVGLAAGVRYAVLIPQVRQMIEAEANGLKLGRFGHLGVEGLSGDLWRDFRVRKLTIRDDKGVWLEAHEVHLAWNYPYLIRRRFVADLAEARSIRVLRRPVLGPGGEDHGLPLSIHIARGQARLILEPEFSVERGVYDVGLELNLGRRGRRSAQVHAESELNRGDRVDLDFAMGGRRPLRISADAVEAKGGAIAGSLGLPAKQPFKLFVRADGRNAEGRFTARATSGALTPLEAEGAWSRTGGQASARVVLTASSLTAPYADRFGQEVSLRLTGNKVGEGAYQLDLSARSDALSIRAQGVGDLGKRKLSKEGLRIEAQAASLGRLAGVEGLGAARVQGALTGNSGAWAFKGDGVAQDIKLGDYRLSRIAGPIALARGKDGFDLQARLSGAGGQGAGIVAALLGGAPSAVLDAQRRADGQLVVRNVELKGSGLNVALSGERGLLGASRVKGEARISNLGAARPGAAGAAVADFQARQPRKGAAWAVDLDARGERLALGLAELDRLLGPQARLRVAGGWQDGRLSVDKATLEGAALSANASGVLQRDRTLAFKTDWQASGPLRAGPVEISGKAKGTGDIGGTLTAPRVDLVADFDEIDVPRLPLRNGHLVLTFQQQADGSSGTVALTAASAYGPATGRSDFRFPRGGVDLTGLSVDAGGLKAQGSVALRRRSPSAADLRLSVDPGAWLDAGHVEGTAKIVEAPGGARGDIDLRAQNVRLPGATVSVASATVAAEGPMSELPYAVSAQGASPEGAWSVDGRGTFAQAEDGYALTLDGAGKVGRRSMKTTEPARFRFGGASRSARLRLVSQDGGRIALDGVFQGGSADVKARAEKLGLNILNRDFAGSFDGVLDLHGQGERLDGAMSLQVADARAGGSPASQGVDGELKARLSDNALTLDVQTTNDRGLKANANLVLPTEASAAPFRIAIARQRPMSGRFFAEGEIQPLFELLVGGERSLAGLVQTQGTLAGTLADPRASGQFSVERGRFEDGATGLSLRDLTLKANFSEDAVTVSQVQGQDGAGGQLSGAGTISLQRNGLSSFRLDLKSFRLIDNETATATASGQATINRDAKGQVKLAGELTIERADVAADPPTPSGVVAMDVVEVNRPASLPAALPPKDKTGEGWALDVKLHAPRRVFLRGRGLDVEFSLDAHVGGTTANPDLTGTARVIRGDYDFAGKRFEFDDSGYVRLSTHPGDIRIHLDATREDPTLTVTIQIRGTAERPEITLASSPSLPNDEILSKVLFERSASQLSGVEAAQLASALSSLAGGGGLDILGNLRSFAGLDRLAFGGDEQSGVTVSGGKYLSDDLYLELTGGGREGPSAQVEWRVRRRLSIISRFAGQAGNKIAVRWRKDY